MEFVPPLARVVLETESEVVAEALPVATMEPPTKVRMPLEILRLLLVV